MFKRGIDTYAKHVCRRRRDGSQRIPLFVLFVLFGQAKRTLKEKKHEETFIFSYFSVKKSTKSQQGGLAPSSFRTIGGVHELVAGSSAWQVRAAKDKVKIGDFAALRNLNHTTRANISHEKAEQIRARKPARPLKGDFSSAKASLNKKVH